MILLIFICSLLLAPLSQAFGQTTTHDFDPSEIPQWAKDLRRWNIISFGVFPFSMFFTRFVTDIIRWNNHNDFSYAPWPVNFAGSVEMTNSEIGRTLLIAAGVSATIALVDIIIIRNRREGERRHIESRPAGTVTIERVPISTDEDEDE
jgi:hypothetical protein